MLKKIDLISIKLYIILILFGFISIYSVSPDKAYKQLIWILSTNIIMIILFNINYKKYKKISFNFHYIVIILLIIVLIAGKKINGAKAWLNIGFVNFQPSELAKISTSLCVAHVLSSKKKILQTEFNVLITIILILPLTLILIQPDIGSVLIFLSFLIIFYREGKIKKLINLLLLIIFIFSTSIILNPKIISVVTSIWCLIHLIYTKKYMINKKFIFIIICCINLFCHISPVIYNNIIKQYHKDRITILFKNELDNKYNKNLGYNLLSAKTAISSGQIIGKGFQAGIMTEGKFIPEQFTDYIFCTIGEEWGLTGIILLITLFVAFIGRIYFISEIINNTFGRIIGYSLASITLIHLIINLNMVMGVIPTIGIPLPLISYGGSSLFLFTVLLAIFMNIYATSTNKLNT
jgi:rod shape determining protein RodA